VPNRGAAAELAPLLAAWAAGLYAGALGSAGARGGLAWTAAVAGCGLLCAAPGLFGFGSSLPAVLFRLFAILAAAAFPLRRLYGAWRAGRAGSLLASFLSSALLSLALGQALLARAGLAPELAAPLAAACAVLLAGGYRLAQEGYLLDEGWSGQARRERERESLLAEARRRLLAAEDGLELAGRTAAPGLLAAGVAHELRGILGLAQAAAEFGLRRGEPEAMSRSLQLVAEQAAQGRRALGEVLEPVASGREAEPERIRLPDDIEDLLRLARASFRREGISLEYGGGEAAAARARKGELEQALLNVLANAADSVRRCRQPGEREIRVRFRRAAGMAELEVEDNGSGVDPLTAGSLFQPGVSAKGSTGIGLYLARRLAERNGGSLELVALPPGRGGLFRLRLPSSE
jgi:signal transduction histidine kinase